MSDLTNMTYEQLIELRLDMQRDLDEKRETMRAVSAELDVRISAAAMGKALGRAVRAAELKILQQGAVEDADAAAKEQAEREAKSRAWKAEEAAKHAKQKKAA